MDNETLPNNVNEDTQLTQGEELALDKMAEGLKQIWIMVAFCIVGWALVCFGFSLMQSNVGVLNTPLVFILGFIVIAIPSLMALAKKGVGGLFNFEYVTETTYADGHKTRTTDFAGTGVMKIVLFILVVILGVIITPLRVLKSAFGYKKAQKYLGIEKQDFVLSVRFPVIVGLAAFVLLIIISSIVGSSLANKNAKSDYAGEQLVTMIEEVETQYAGDTFSYKMSDSSKVCSINVTHNANGSYSFTVGAFSEYDLDSSQMVERPETDSLIAFGTYTVDATGNWNTTDTTITSYLANLKLDKLIPFDAMKTNSSKLNGQDKDDVIQISYENNDNEPYFEYNKETKRFTRMCNIDGFENYNITFNY